MLFFFSSVLICNCNCASHRRAKSWKLAESLCYAQDKIHLNQASILQPASSSKTGINWKIHWAVNKKYMLKWSGYIDNSQGNSAPCQCPFYDVVLNAMIELCFLGNWRKTTTSTATALLAQDCGQPWTSYRSLDTWPEATAPNASRSLRPWIKRLKCFVPSVHIAKLMWEAFKRTWFRRGRSMRLHSEDCSSPTLIVHSIRISWPKISRLLTRPLSSTWTWQERLTSSQILTTTQSLKTSKTSFISWGLCQ